MRRVLRHTAEVMHFWANQVQPEGRAGNVFFDGDRVYSYGTHFCIGRVLPGGAVAFTTRRYSVSTGTHQRRSVSTRAHQRAAESAAMHLRRVYCRDPSDGAHANMTHALNEAASLLSKATKKGIWQTTRVRLRGQALRVAEQANAYLAALPENERGVCTPINTDHLEGIREEIERSEAAKIKLREEALRARMADLQADLAKWRSGELLWRGGLYELPPALRLSLDGQTVHTSHGADIPVSDALMLWPVIQRVIRGVKNYEPGTPIGAYRLTQIRTDGSIRVGCHDIAYGEIEGIARKLGLLEQVAA